MKITSNMSKQFFRCFDEARGVAIHRIEVLKNKNYNTISYIQGKLIVFILLLILSVILAGISYLGIYLYILSLALILFATIYFIITVFNILAVYTYRVKQNFINTIIINKDGIIDESYHGIKMIFKWNKITGIVIGKYAVTILTDTPCYFYFDISKKDDIIKAIEKYGDKNKIIN